MIFIIYLIILKHFSLNRSGTTWSKKRLGFHTFRKIFCKKELLQRTIKVQPKKRIGGHRHTSQEILGWYTVYSWRKFCLIHPREAICSILVFQLLETIWKERSGCYKIQTQFAQRGLAARLSTDSLLDKFGCYTNILPMNMKTQVVALSLFALVCCVFAITLDDVQKMKNDLDKGMKWILQFMLILDKNHAEAFQCFDCLPCL